MNNRFNVKNIYIAMNSKDENGAITRETPEHIAGAMKVSVNPTTASGKQYGDGALSDEITRLTGAGISLEQNRLPTACVNKILGRKKDENGISKDNIDDEPVEFSIGWEVELTGKQSEFIWFTRCKAQPIQSEVAQSTDNVNFSNDTLNITAMPDENGDVRLFGETIDPLFKCKDTWFLSVPPVPKAI